jgi:hypothetical protein
LLTTQKRAGSLLPQEKVMSTFLILKGRIADLWRGRTMAVRSTARALAANAPWALRHWPQPAHQQTGRGADLCCLLHGIQRPDRVRAAEIAYHCFLCLVALVEGRGGQRPSWRVRRGSAGGGRLRFGMAQILSTDKSGKFISMALPVHSSRSPKLDRRPRRCVRTCGGRVVICYQCRAEPCIKTHARPALARHRGARHREQLTAARCPRSSGAASRRMIQHSLLRQPVRLRLVTNSTNDLTKARP